jgi:hypothetical protein
LGFNRSRGVLSGPVWGRPDAVRLSCRVMGGSRLGRDRPKVYESATARSQMVVLDEPPITPFYALRLQNGHERSCVKKSPCASTLLGVHDVVNSRRCAVVSLRFLDRPFLLQRLAGFLGHRLPGRFVSHRRPLVRWGPGRSRCVEPTPGRRILSGNNAVKRSVGWWETTHQPT